MESGKPKQLTRFKRWWKYRTPGTEVVLWVNKSTLVVI